MAKWYFISPLKNPISEKGEAETIKPKKAARGERKSGKAKESGESGRWSIGWGPRHDLPSHYTGGRVPPPTAKTWAAMTAAGKDIF